MVRRSGALLVACLMLGWAGAGSAYERLPGGLARLTPEQALDRVKANEGESETHIVLSTRKVWDRSHDVEGGHLSDVHLRALVDRRDGSARYELWHELDLYGDSREITGMTYRLDGRSKGSNPVRVERSDETCPSVESSPAACHLRIRAAFEIPDHVLQKVAESYRPGSHAPWQLQFTDNRGGWIASGLAPVEVMGLRASVQQLRCTAIRVC
jgi:hypothetical protein